MRRVRLDVVAWVQLGVGEPCVVVDDAVEEVVADTAVQVRVRRSPVREDRER